MIRSPRFTIGALVCLHVEEVGTPAVVDPPGDGSSWQKSPNSLRQSDDLGGQAAAPCCRNYRVWLLEETEE